MNNLLPLAAAASGAAAFVAVYLPYRRKASSLDSGFKGDFLPHTLSSALPPESVIEKIRRFAEEKRTYRIAEIRPHGIVLEGPPGFASPGYYFRIRVAPSTSGGSRLRVAYRPRLPFYWVHWGAKQQLARLLETLEEITS